MLATVQVDGEIRRTLRACAASYNLKIARPDDLLAAVRAVHAGRRLIPPDVAGRLAHYTDDARTNRNPATDGSSPTPAQQFQETDVSVTTSVGQS